MPKQNIEVIHSENLYGLSAMLQELGYVWDRYVKKNINMVLLKKLRLWWETDMQTTSYNVELKTNF